MSRSLIKILFVFILFMSFYYYASAQFYNGSQMSFGKNRIQYNEERIWSQFRFKDFDFIFYQDGRKISINAAKYASKALDEISKNLSYKPQTKMHFVVFNKLSELKTSNIGLDDEVLYNVGGVTNVIDKKVILNFDGSYINLEKQIRSGISRVIINQMIYGEQIVSNVKNSALISLPEWYINGLVSYFSEEWSTELDNRLRDAILSNRFKKFNHLEGTDATLAGHAVWRFVAQQYGADAIPNIIYMTKVSHSVENGFIYVIGSTFKSLLKEWYTNTMLNYKKDRAYRNELPQNNTKVKIKKNNFYYQVKTSPDNRFTSYVKDKSNKKKLFLLNNETGKREKLYKLGTKIEEIPDMSFPITTWHPTSELFVWVVEKKGRIKMFLYNMSDQTSDEFYLENINKVLDMAYSPDGSIIVMSAIINGYSDIFLFHTSSRTLNRITNDIYDDLHPRFISDKMIAFASSRISDTLELERETYLVDHSKIIKHQNCFDIFGYDIATKGSVLHRITNTPAINETKPMPWSEKYFSFLSDENGIYNRKLACFDSAIAFVDTTIHYNYFTKIFSSTDFTYSLIESETYSNSPFYSDVFTQNNKSIIFVSEKNDSVLSSNPQNTLWAGERNLDFIAEQLNENATKPEVKQPSKQGFLDTQKENSGGVNIYNYKFTTNTDKKKTAQNKEDIYPDSFILPRQQNYDVEYGFDKIVSQLDFSFLNTSYQPYNSSVFSFGNAGSNALFKVGVSDLLEDKRIIGAIRTNFSLKNNEYFLSYEDMSKRIDKQIVLHRMTYDIGNEEVLNRHHIHDINYILKYPFSQALAIRGTTFLKYDNQVFKSISDATLSKPNINSFWAGVRLELIFDNTKNPLINIYNGLRYKVFAEYYQGINNSKLNLITIGFDFRHYSKIHRTFIWANRVAGGTSFGSTRLLYFLGGTDNTFLPSFNATQPVDNSMSFAFQTIGTNMRGFPQNIRNGNTFAVINSELRFPIFRYLLNRPIKSQFINNFQAIAFGDVGSAWLGLNPFEERNITTQNSFYQKPITVIVKKPRNPFVGGMGFGVRTTMLGYFLRFDVAWGVEEMRIYSPRYVLSFSLDF